MKASLGRILEILGSPAWTWSTETVVALLADLGLDQATSDPSDVSDRREFVGKGGLRCTAVWDLEKHTPVSLRFVFPVEAPVLRQDRAHRVWARLGRIAMATALGAPHVGRFKSDDRAADVWTVGDSELRVECASGPWERFALIVELLPTHRREFC